MRLMIFTMAILFLGSVTGCCSTHTHGICDCEMDDYCTSRAPWVRTNSAPESPAETLPAPTKLPELKPKGL